MYQYVKTLVRVLGACASGSLGRSGRAFEIYTSQDTCTTYIYIYVYMYMYIYISTLTGPIRPHTYVYNLRAYICMSHAACVYMHTYVTRWRFAYTQQCLRMRVTVTLKAKARPEREREREG